MAPRHVELDILKRLRTTVDAMTHSSNSLDITSTFLNQWFYSGASVEQIGQLYATKTDDDVAKVIMLILPSSRLDGDTVKRQSWLRKRGLALACEKGVKGGRAWDGINYQTECGVLKLLIDEGWGNRERGVMAKIASFL